jgi:hypothetical protein
VQNCLHCVATIPGDKVPRPLGTQLHATNPNEILHFDFLYIGLSRYGKYQFLLLLKNDLSGYLWLVVLHARVASLLLFHNMTVLVVYDSHLLQILNELEEVLLSTCPSLVCSRSEP